MFVLKRQKKKYKQIHKIVNYVKLFVDFETKIIST